jgi:hypothetical protein
LRMARESASAARAAHASFIGGQFYRCAAPGATQKAGGAATGKHFGRLAIQ